MALILHIDTAETVASIALAQDGSELGYAENATPFEHGSWLPDAILSLLASVGLSINQLNAIALVAGPGSYTGLRVGMATAKGICFALKIPLITENTLLVMAAGYKAENTLNDNDVMIPLLDARRMEVFAGCYSYELQETQAPVPHILSAESFSSWPCSGNKIYMGSGFQKWQDLKSPIPVTGQNFTTHARMLIPLALAKYQTKNFSAAATLQPFYGKEVFFMPAQ